MSAIANRDELSHVTFDHLNELREYDIISQQEYDLKLKAIFDSLNTDEVEFPDVPTQEESHNESKSNSSPITSPPFELTPEDIANGEYLSTEEIKDGNGATIKTIHRKMQRTVRQVTVPKAVFQRRNIAKFGQCAGKPQGPERGITTLGELVHFEVVGGDAGGNPQDREDDKSIPKLSVVTCRRCNQPGHWTKDCTYTDSMLQMKSLIDTFDIESSNQSTNESQHPDQQQQIKADKYVPPSRRNGSTESSSSLAPQPKTNIRVNNLDEDATEDDLRDLFDRFGKIKRVTVVRDKHTRLSRGFAYVDFYDSNDATQAISLNGHPYGNQILDVSWAKSMNTETIANSLLPYRRDN